MYGSQAKGATSFCRKLLMLLVVLAFSISIGLHVRSVAAEKGGLSIYLSADQTGVRASGVSIEQGIRVALDEVNNRLGGFNVSLKVLDHRGSTPRAKKHLSAYLKDPTALAVFSGLHSPPLLATRELINRKRILVLDPWAAAGPITRYPSAENWIFRLSIDDSKAGHIITHYALNRGGIKQPALLLEQTGWGKSNNRTMTKALNEKGLKPAAVRWFNWGVGIESMRILIREMRMEGADGVFFVGNAPEGKILAKAMASLPAGDRVPIFSHWGITGGDFPEVIDLEIRSKLSLSFIQTSFSFLQKLSPFQQEVLESIYRRFPKKIKKPLDIKAPTGFIHAYDMTRLLIAAVKTVKLTDNIKANRLAVREALENINTPVRGLIKSYNRPFTAYSENNPDAHEALGLSDFTMAHYGEKNEIIVLPVE